MDLLHGRAGRHCDVDSELLVQLPSKRRAGKLSRFHTALHKCSATSGALICRDWSGQAVEINRANLPKSGCCLWTQVRLERSSGSSRSSSVPSTAGR
jgi:hypothetical protein